MFLPLVENIDMLVLGSRRLFVIEKSLVGSIEQRCHRGRRVVRKGGWLELLIVSVNEEA